MANMRKYSRRYGSHFLALVLAVLGMTALVPAGHMVAPSAGHLISVVPCPKTNALARAFAAESSIAAGDESSGAAESSGILHGVDHVAMGHIPPQGDDAEGGVPTASQRHVDCAFSSLAFAASLPEELGFEQIEVEASKTAERPFPVLILARGCYLRPPMRAPPLRG